MSRETKLEIKPDTKSASREAPTVRPANPRANVMPVDGYVLSIDRKLKQRYDTAADAMTAATKLKQQFPLLQVAVLNAADNEYTPVELPEK